jgi:hypothetical protein
MYATFYGDFDIEEEIVVSLDGNESNIKPENLTLTTKTIKGRSWAYDLICNSRSSRKTNPSFDNIIEDTNNMIDIEYILSLYEKQEGVSYFLKIPFDLKMKNILTSPSLDRIDNSKGYEKGNIRIVTRFENMGRRNANY